MHIILRGLLGAGRWAHGSGEQEESPWSRQPSLDPPLASSLASYVFFRYVGPLVRPLQAC
eukprot:1144442-Pelagomonas_calceolata.AAC.4